MIIDAIFIDNCGHGYLQVSRDDFKKVIDNDNADKISGYSGYDRLNYYLEEDCDAPAFIEIANSKGIVVEYTNYYQPRFECPKNYQGALSV